MYSIERCEPCGKNPIISRKEQNVEGELQNSFLTAITDTSHFLSYTTTYFSLL